MLFDYLLMGLMVFAAPMPFWVILMSLVSGKHWLWRLFSYFSIILAWAVLGYLGFAYLGLIFNWNFKVDLFYFPLGLVIVSLATLLFYEILRSLGLKSLICINQLEKSGELVSSGIYRYGRHPRYADYALFSLGFGFLTGYYVFFLFALYIFVGFWAATFFEEKELLERFPGYKEYKKKVPKFFIRL